MLYIKNERVKTFLGGYLKPLDINLQIGILIWILISGLLIQIFKNVREKKKKFQITVTIKSILKSLQVFCNQGFVYYFTILFFFDWFLWLFNIFGNYFF